jgi:agmatinase
LRRAIEDVGVRAHVVGARAYVGEEVEFAKDVGVSFEKKAGVLTFDFVNSCRELYISVDVDYFDPSVAPGVANPEPGGASFDEFLRTLSSVVYKSGVVGLDVVEIAPPYDDGTTAVLGARIIVEIVGALER